MVDLEIAKKQLKENNYSFVAVKNGEIIAHENGGGIKPIFNVIEELKEEINGSAIADKVIGKAAAMLCVYGKIGAVYTPVISSCALDVLKENEIPVTTEKVVPAIMNKDFSDACPLEKISDKLFSPEVSRNIIKDFLEKNSIG